MEQPELPLGGNYNPDNFRLFFRDTGLLIGSLDEESQEDLRNNKNFNTYKGAIYENIVGDMLVKQGYKLYFYKNAKNLNNLSMKNAKNPQMLSMKNAKNFYCRKNRS